MGNFFSEKYLMMFIFHLSFSLFIFKLLLLLVPPSPRKTNKQSVSSLFFFDLIRRQQNDIIITAMIASRAWRYYLLQQLKPDFTRFISHSAFELYRK